MQPKSTSVISVRSHQQAMDWSLVLVSQGIECAIEHDAEEGIWRLLVDGSDGQRALQALRQYRVENRAPGWRQRLPWTGLMFDWRSVAWFVLLAVIFLVGQAQYPLVTQAGMMDRQAVWGGQWWRLFTAVTLHRDLAHLISNLTAGVFLLGLAMGSFGSGIGLLAAYLAGVAGNLAGLVLYSGKHLSLGASGMIFGTLGLLAGQTIGLLRAGLSGRQLAVRGFLSGFLLLVLFGLNPDSDVIAHAGGFIAGVLLGGLLATLPTWLAENPLANRVAEILCAALVIVSWCLALSS